MEKFIFLKKIKNFIIILFDRDASMFLPNPYRDWMFAVFVFLGLTTVLAGIGIYLLIELNRGEIFIIERKTQLIETIDAEKLQNVVEENEKQKQTFNNLLLEQPSVVDPSL